MSDIGDRSWRPKLVPRLRGWLERGEPIALVGGPGLGKSYLRSSLIGLSGDVAEIDPSRGEVAPEDHRVIPLSPLPRHRVVEFFGEDAFPATGGHLLLLRGWLDDSLEDARDELRDRLAAFREIDIDAWKLFENLRDFDGTPAERYEESRRHCDKAELDRLATVGLISRSIYVDQAGIEVVGLG